MDSAREFDESEEQSGALQSVEEGVGGDSNEEYVGRVDDEAEAYGEVQVMRLG